MKKEDILKHYQAYKLIVFPVVIALSSLFLIVFAIYPQITKLISNHRVAGDLNAKSKFLETKVSALEGINAEDLSKNVSFTLQALPPDKDYGNALGLLQQLVTRPGFSISSITLSNTSSKLGNVDGFEVKLELKGTRVMFQALLNLLEQSPHLLRVNNFDITFNSGQQTLDVALAVEVLYSQLPQNLGTADAPLPQISQKDNEVLSALAGAGINAASLPATAEGSSRGKANPFE